jgi:hypothetical protein
MKENGMSTTIKQEKPGNTHGGDEGIQMGEQNRTENNCLLLVLIQYCGLLHVLHRCRGRDDAVYAASLLMEERQSGTVSTARGAAHGP